LFYANRFIRLADKYLYHPNSPLRNEDCYLYFIESIISFAKLPFADSVMYCNRLNLLKKNRVGYIACNFAFSLESSKTVSLYEVSSPFVLLLFYDPDCETCRATIKSLSHNEMIDKLQKNSMLKVLSICPDGYSQQWFSFRTNIPPSWINGYDKDVSIRKWQMYDLKAMPTLYLLNGRKEVVVKDGTVDSIVEYLRGIESR
jgi:peroxiredoxin